MTRSLALSARAPNGNWHACGLKAVRRPGALETRQDCDKSCPLDPPPRTPHLFQPYSAACCGSWANGAGGGWWSGGGWEEGDKGQVVKANPRWAGRQNSLGRRDGTLRLGSSGRILQKRSQSNRREALSGTHLNIIIEDVAMASTRTCPMRPSHSGGISLGLARIKGMTCLDEMLDVVDFGVSTSRGQDFSAMERRLKHPSRLAIKRSDLKFDGARKRWHCDKDVRRFEELADARKASSVVAAAARNCVVPDARFLAEAGHFGLKRRC